MPSLLEHCLGEKRTLCLPNDNLLKTTSKTKLRRIIHEEFLLAQMLNGSWLNECYMLFCQLPLAFCPLLG